MLKRKRRGTDKRKGARPTDKRQLLTTKDVGVQQKETIPTTSQTENNHPYIEPTSTGMAEREETKMPIIHRPITKKAMFATTSQTENNHPYTEPTSTGMTEREETKMPIIHRPITKKDVGVQQTEAIPTTSQTENNHPYTEPTSTGMTEREETKMTIIHRPITKKEQKVKFALDHYQAPTEELRIVLIGKTGVGKSKTGNSIIGRNGNIFPYGCDQDSITKFCMWKTTYRFGKKIDVVDTPGVFETKTDNYDIQKEIARCIGLTSPGPHAIILCVKMGRFSAEDKDTLEHFLKYFGQELLKFAIVVFTHVDQWEEDAKNKEDDAEDKPKDYLTADQYIKNSNPELKEFIENCGNRYLFFNNRLKGREQDEMVRNMVQKIEQLVHTNNGKCFIDENFIKVEQALKIEIEITKKTRDEVKSSSKFFEIISAIITFLKNKIWFK